MATSASYSFNINLLNSDEQKKFQTVYNDLKSRHETYFDYKRNLLGKEKFHEEEEENEWRYEIHRHLRARKWNVSNTNKSLLEMIQWRIDNQVDSILDDPSVQQRMNYFRKCIPSAFHGYTKAQRPLYVEQTGRINVDDIMINFTHDELIQCHIYWFEYSCRLAREHSRHLGQHVESIAGIYDLHGMKMDVRKLLNTCKQCLYIDDNYYPERLGQLFVVNPPAVFPALWNLVKHFIDPVTKRKIMILKKGNETTTNLLQHVDSNQLPSEYGGTCRSCATAPNCLSVS
ncbi:unnamed protein product [Adineta ricciae]|uniref:CRAL-TRIO domain-containing protein n=1 Tax=Adineta ricciae TaxID=249248 RepID=A0A814WBH2_ADIRI|nr:unnamed protein product [Adineta ricciae]CAF1260221.1 unnamed protein product [Adineta ricciae]